MFRVHYKDEFEEYSTFQEADRRGVEMSVRYDIALVLDTDSNLLYRYIKGNLVEKKFWLGELL